MIPDFIQKNAWGIAIAGITLVSTYTLYGYRISALEAQTKEMQSTINTSSAVEIQIQLSLVKLQTDMTYVKKAVEKLNP